MLDGIRESYKDTATHSDSPDTDLELTEHEALVDQARYRASQLETIFRLINLNVTGNLICGCLTLAVMSPTSPGWQLWLWGSSLALLMLPPLLAQRHRSSDHQPRQAASIKSIQRCTLHSIALSVCWSFPSLVTFSYATSEQQIFLATIITGMMCAGGFSLYPIRAAALFYTGIMAVSTAITLMYSALEIRLWLLLLLIVYTSILIIIINNSHKVFQDNVFSGFKMERRKRVIELLLTNFQQSTTDVLWQLDKHLGIQNAASDLANKLETVSAHLDGQNFLEAISKLQQTLPEEYTHPGSLGLYELKRSFQEGNAFNYLELPVMQGQSLSWWAITAKPFEGGHWVGCITDNTKRYEASRKAWKLAHEDTATGLSNRRAFHEAVIALFRHMEPNQTHAMLCIDLDRFKSVNDAFGHDSGDHLLQIVAARLKKHARNSDAVARTGGDEFSILLRNISHAEASQIAQAILGSLKQPCQIGSNNVLAGASIGLAMIPEHGQTLEVLRKNADLALYEAKKQGRGRLISFCQQMAERADKKTLLEQALRQALPNHELSLVYQPQQDLSENVTLSAEALLRWTSQELGAIDTQTFINIAEDSGQIHALGEWVIDQACAFLAQTPELPRLAINASPLQLANPTFVDDITSAVRRHHIEPARLELEITETVLLDDSHGAAEKLRNLKAFGIRIALDDFGTGYSSLRYLQTFPFDKIKIDRSFVMELNSSSSSLAIVEAIINMAHAMGMEVVAEGVESESTQALLKRIGCDTVQGYAISMPLKPGELTQYLKQIPVWKAD